MNGCMYQPYLLMYWLNDLKPEMEIQKYDWTTDWVLRGLRTQREYTILIVESEHNINQTEV